MHSIWQTRNHQFIYRVHFLFDKLGRVVPPKRTYTRSVPAGPMMAKLETGSIVIGNIRTMATFG